MDAITLFEQLLRNQVDKPSESTVKNYLSDLRYFILWFQNTYNQPFTPEIIDSSVLKAFDQANRGSLSSHHRRVFAIKKFFTLLSERDHNITNIFQSIPTSSQDDPWKLRDFKNNLYSSKSSSHTVKNYLHDITSFIRWLETTSPNANLNSITPMVVEEYRNRLIQVLMLSPRSVNRKLSSIRKYLSVLDISAPQLSNVYTAMSTTSKDINLENIASEKVIYSDFLPVMLFQRALHLYTNAQNEIADLIARYVRTRYANNTQNPNIPTRAAIENAPIAFYIPLGKKGWLENILPRYRPAWYISYHKISFVKQLHIGILIVVCCLFGFLIYNGFMNNENSVKKAVLGTETSIPKRLIHFNGRLADSNQKPINTPETVIFSIYNHPTDSVNNKIWSESRSIHPDKNGIFSISLGQNKPIPERIFQDNNDLYLGIAIGGSSELIPRKHLTTTGFAADSKLLDGMLPITNPDANSKNTILALDSSGNLHIGGTADPVFQATGGDFTVSGENVVLLTNAGSQGDIILQTEDSGSIDLQSSLKNSSTSGIIPGALTIEDSVMIQSGEVLRSAMTINVIGNGDLFTASNSGSTKFLIANNGNVGIGTNTPSYSLDVNGGVNILGATRLNQVEYFWPNSDGISDSVLRTDGSGKLTWKSLTDIVKTPFLVGSGAIYPQDSSIDFLLGGSTQSSAKFGLIGLNSSTPTATLSGNLTFNGARLINTTSYNSLSIGDNNTGNILFTPAGSIGIGLTNPGYKFEIKGDKGNLPITQIYNASTSNDADGLNIRLGNASASTINTTNHFLNFYTDGVGLAGAVTGNGGTGVTYSTTAVADFAEYMEKDENDTIPYGSLVCLLSTGLVSSCTSNQNLIGVASETPAFLGGKNNGNRSIAVGYMGQISVRVTGTIKPGDLITTSNIPGVGKKATEAGYSIGKAISGTSQNTQESRVMIVLNPSWYDPDVFINEIGQIEANGIMAVSSTNPILSQNEQIFTVKRAGQVITRIASLGSATIGTLTAGLINTQQLVVRGSITAGNILTDEIEITGDKLSISGVSLKSYILSVMKDYSSALGPQPGIDTSTMHTNMISPLSDKSDIILSLDNSKFSIYPSKEATSSAVASIDNQGNASFSGSLYTDTLNTHQATISGTLTADTIIANSIQGLDTTVASIASQFSVNTAPHTFVDIASVSAGFATIRDGLVSFGPATFTTASILDQLSIGTSFILSGNSFNTLGQDLEIQPLKQGNVSFFAGMVTIDTTGNLVVNGDALFKNNLTVEGKLATNILSPLANKDLTIHLNNKDNGQGQSINVLDGSKSTVFGVFNNGDVVSSGSAIFARDLVASGSALLSKLNIFSKPVEALSDTEVRASGSAGLTSIKAYRRQITIYTPLVTQDSLIYITPIGNTGNQVLYLERQIPGESFTVGIAESVGVDIPFNWIIVN